MVPPITSLHETMNNFSINQGHNLQSVSSNLQTLAQNMQNLNMNLDRMEEKQIQIAEGLQKSMGGEDFFRSTNVFASQNMMDRNC